jgi:hypothetical protein
MPVFAVLAVFAFGFALGFHLLGHGTADLVIDLLYGGFLCVALHLATGWTWGGWSWAGHHRAGAPQ